MPDAAPISGDGLPRLWDALSEAFRDHLDGSSDWHKPLNT
jgi:hypothetical protein